MSKLGTAISKFAGRTGLRIKAHSPEILLVIGIGSIIGGAVFACKATLRSHEVVEEHLEKIDSINEAIDIAKDGGAEYTEDDKKKDLTVTYIQTTVAWIKLYGPAVTLATVGIGCILWSFKIIKGRNVALMAAYKVLEEGFAAYRKRVVDEFGEEKDHMFKYGLKAEEYTDVETDADGKTKKVKKTKLVKDMDANALYGRVYDSSCKGWSPSSTYNLMFIQRQQDYANDLLRSRGYIFLSDVYKVLGFDETPESRVVGWRMNNKDGNGFVDFGLETNGVTEQALNDGMNNAIPLTFNVDGTIVWDFNKK